MKVERLEINNPETYEMSVRDPTIVKESGGIFPIYESGGDEFYFKVKALSNFSYIKELLVSLKGIGTFLFKNGNKVDEEGKFKFEKCLKMDPLNKEAFSPYDYREKLIK